MAADILHSYHDDLAWQSVTDSITMPVQDHPFVLYGIHQLHGMIFTTRIIVQDPLVLFYCEYNNSHMTFIPIVILISTALLVRHIAFVLCVVC